MFNFIKKLFKLDTCVFDEDKAINIIKAAIANYEAIEFLKKIPFVGRELHNTAKDTLYDYYSDEILTILKKKNIKRKKS